MAGRERIQRPNSDSRSRISQVKMVLLGEASVGKSSLILRFGKGQFDEHQVSTIGAAFMTQTVCVEDKEIRLDIWDTAGQERYASMAPMYYRGAQAALVVYDITSQDSFARAKLWVRELQRQASPDIVMALVGNKADLEDGLRAVEAREARVYAEENSMLFTETSAKSGLNVNTIFLSIAKRLAEKEQEYLNQQRQGLQLTDDAHQRRKPRCCK